MYVCMYMCIPVLVFTYFAVAVTVIVVCSIEYDFFNTFFDILFFSSYSLFLLNTYIKHIKFLHTRFILFIDTLLFLVFLFHYYYCYKYYCVLLSIYKQSLLEYQRYQAVQLLSE